MHAGELGHVLDVVDHDPADAGGHRRGQLGGRLGVAVHVDPLGREAGLERQVQLAARRDVAAEALLARTARARRSPGTPWRRTAPRRGRRGSLRSASRNLRARARRSSSAITYTGVPNASRELDGVAAADRQAARGHGRGVRVDAAGGGRHDRAGSMTHSLAHVVDVPDGDPWGGLVILHGAGSRKENHADMAAAAVAAGLCAVRYDARGHGETGGRLDGRALEDVAAAAALLPAGLPVALRGSSMGGYLALVAAARRRRGRGRRDLPGAGGAAARRAADRAAGVRRRRRRSRRCLAAHPLEEAVGALACPCSSSTPRATRRCRSPAPARCRSCSRHPASRLEVYRRRRPPLRAACG